MRKHCMDYRLIFKKVIMFQLVKKCKNNSLYSKTSSLRSSVLWHPPTPLFHMTQNVFTDLFCYINIIFVMTNFPTELKPTICALFRLFFQKFFDYYQESNVLFKQVQPLSYWKKKERLLGYIQRTNVIFSLKMLFFFWKHLLSFII